MDTLARLAAVLERLEAEHLDTPSRDIEPVSAVNLRKFTTDRPSKKLQKALDWLRDNPGHLDTPSRDIDALIGVSHMTVFKAQQIMKGIDNG